MNRAVFYWRAASLAVAAGFIGLWALFGAHLVLDTVAFVGFALLAGKVSWLPVK